MLIPNVYDKLKKVVQFPDPSPSMDNVSVDSMVALNAQSFVEMIDQSSDCTAACLRHRVVPLEFHYVGTMRMRDEWINGTKALVASVVSTIYSSDESNSYNYALTD